MGGTPQYADTANAVCTTTYTTTTMQVGTSTTPNYSKAVRFTGSGQYLGIAHDHQSDLLDLPNYTIAVWFKVESGGSGGFHSNIPLVTKGAPFADNTDYDVAMWLGLESNSLALRFEGPTGTDYSATSSTNVADNAWHLGVASATSGAIKLYVDGVQVGQSSPAEGPASVETNAFMIGRGCGIGFTSSCTGQFFGYIASVRVWSGVLTDSQVSEMNSTCGISSLPTPVLDLSMQDVSPAASDGASLSSSYTVSSSVGALAKQIRMY